MSVTLKSDNTTDELRIDTAKAGYVRPRDLNGNDLSLAIGNKVAATQGYALIGGKNDEFAVPLRVDRLGNQILGQAMPQIFDFFEGTTINSQKWNVANTTFAPAQTALGLSMNPTNVTTASAVSVYQSFKLLFKLPRIPLQYKARARVSTVAGSVAELGFGNPTGTTAIIPNSAHWRISGSSSAVPILTFNNIEIVGSPVDLSAEVGNFLVYDVIVDDDGAIFTIHDTQNDVLLSRQTLQVQKSSTKMWAVTRLPIFHRLYNSGTPASAPVFVITEIQSLAHDLALPREYQTTLAMNQLGGYLSPTAFTQNANYANSAAPASATLSNTAAGYTTLGGQFQFAAVAGAETDYCLFGFAVPAGYQLVVNGIRIETFNMGAAVATTPTLLQWGVGINGATANLATGGHFRKALGSQSLAVATPIGGEATKIIEKTFKAPLITESARVFAVILKMPVGTATASQIIRGVVDIDGYFE